MKLGHIVLGTLLRQPSTGYDLKKFLDVGGRFMRSNTTMSQVYRVLGSMEERGWVTHAVEHRPGAQDAKTFRVTDEGATVFLDWLTGPYTPPSRFEDPDFGVRLAFAAFMSVDQVLRLLDIEIDARLAQIARYRDRDRSLTWDTTVPVDLELGDIVAEWSHRKGADSIDAHVARLHELRGVLLDLRSSAPAHADETPMTPA
jgi:PadR family transcriptional regulator AphA